MGNNTSIEWTEATWNPWHGCHKVSPGCKFCYMYRDKERYGQDPNTVVRSKTTFKAPLKWEDPLRVFTCSWSDFFIEEADPWREEAWDIIRQTPHHTYQILTKRPERIREHLPSDWDRQDRWRHVWLGVSVENQKAANERIPHLLDVPAALRFLSCEPLLGPINLLKMYPYPSAPWSRSVALSSTLMGGHRLKLIDWVIVGGESGPGARPMDVKWLRAIVKQCANTNAKCFVKQLGSRFAVNYYDHEYREEYESHGWEWPEPMDWNTRHGQPPVGSRVHIRLKDRKGGDWSEWPEDLRVRQFPAEV